VSGRGARAGISLTAPVQQTHTAGMRSVLSPAVSCVIAAGACLLAGAAPATDDSRQQTIESPPPLERGEIVIRPTGKKRVTRATSAPTTQPVAAKQANELSYEGPGPRVVTIGYFVRDPIETGWGPLVHEPAYTPCYPSYGDYGYGGYNGSYISTPSYRGTPSLFGSSSYCGSSSPITVSRRCR
jgi:hypothetical protein